MRFLSLFLLSSMTTFTKRASLKCYALASRGVGWKQASRSGRVQANTFVRGGFSFNDSRLNSATADSIENKTSFAAIAGPSVMKDFGGLSFCDSSDRYRVVFVLGGPGAGKGTQSDLLLKEYPCVHLSAGQLLRDETKKEDSPHASLIEECIVAGKIVPVDISLTLLRNAMEESPGKSCIFLIDGFPRNFDNLEGWVRVMQNVANVWGVLVYQCPLSVLEERILERAKESGRSDDNLESLRKRFKTFEDDTMPVIDTLRNLKQESTMNVWDITGDQTMEKVWEETQSCMNSLIKNDVVTANMQLLKAIAEDDVDMYQTLSADEMFEGKSPEEVMHAQEGVKEFPDVRIMDAELNFISGKKVSVTYKRISSTTTFKETRVWSHEESTGWKTIHYSRSPL